MTTTATTTLPLVGIKYKTVITNVEAERDSKNNLIMHFRLNHQKQEATFSCVEQQHVGAHSPREVQFTASDDCILHFDNPIVFGTNHKELFKGIKSSLGVNGTINNQSTTYWVEYIPPTGAAKAVQPTSQPAAATKILAPPVIVVP